VGCLQFIRTLLLHAALKLSDNGYGVGCRYTMETGSYTNCIIAQGEHEEVSPSSLFACDSADSKGAGDRG
jgi:hypothetical protein